MAVTELARLHLKNNKGLDYPDNESVRVIFLSAIKAQAEYAAYPVYIFTEVEDPSYVYILGGWVSVEAHMKHWIPSETNQQTLATIKDDVEVSWLQHINIDPRPRESNSSVIPLNAPVIAISRYFVQDLKKEDFRDMLCGQMHYLEKFTARESFAGGWRLDPERREEVKNGNGEKKQEEFVLFSGWDAVENHVKFGESEVFKNFAKTNDFLQGTEIRHAVRWAASS